MTPIWEYSWDEIIVISIACVIIGAIVQGFVVPHIIKYLKNRDKENK